MKYAKLAFAIAIYAGLGLGTLSAVWGCTENAWASAGLALVVVCVLLWLDASIGAYRNDTVQRLAGLGRREPR